VNLSRKEFFRKSLFSLGEAVVAITGAVQPQADAAPEIREGGEFVPTDRPDLLAMADNALCLARNCGCFACIERCEPKAIHLVFGTGIRIDEDACTGCGLCEHICPVTPKAISLTPRTINEGTPA
jgi:ferredoxin